MHFLYFLHTKGVRPVMSVIGCYQLTLDLIQHKSYVNGGTKKIKSGSFFLAVWT